MLAAQTSRVPTGKAALEFHQISVHKLASMPVSPTGKLLHDCHCLAEELISMIFRVATHWSCGKRNIDQKTNNHQHGTAFIALAKEKWCNLNLGAVGTEASILAAFLCSAAKSSQRTSWQLAPGVQCHHRLSKSCAAAGCPSVEGF
jgi:hypothetical protein